MCASYVVKRKRQVYARGRAKFKTTGLDLKRRTFGGKLRVMTNKQIVRDLLQQIPDDASLHEIARKLEFIAAVRQGLTELDNRQSVTVEELEQDLTSWVTKYDSHTLREQT